MKTTMLPALNEDTIAHCAICGSAHVRALGSKDFGESGGDAFIGRRAFPDYEVRIPYFKCDDCAFTFTHAFDKWSPADYQQHIYNDDYILCDQPFLEERPLRNAHLVAGLFHRELPATAILDVGGGSGKFCSTLSALGANTDQYDPFFGHKSWVDDKQFDLITSFEVMEHVAHRGQRDWMATIASMLKQDGNARVLLSTELVQPGTGLEWWYIAPRNGHISMHSAKSLAIVAEQVGLSFYSINPSMHLMQWSKASAFSGKM